jgi:hypothetical protein
MKSNRTGAIFNPWASTRFMMGFLGRNGVQRLFSGESSKKRAKKGSVGRPFSPKAGSMRSA